MTAGPQPRWVTFAAGVIRALPAGRYLAMNWVARTPRDPFWSTLPSELGGFKFRCDLRDPLMREVCFTGQYEPQETVLLRALLGPGMTFVDVGANWGYFTLVGAHLVGQQGRVVSVEADPRACQVVRANIAENGLTQVVLVAAAASDRPGTLSLQAYGQSNSDSGHFGVAASTSVIEGGARFDVPARPLEELLRDAGVDRVDVMKMDIEGAEAKALPGLGRYLTEGRIARLILELHPAHLRDQGGSAAAVVTDLLASGYRAWRIDQSPDAYRRAASGRLAAERLLSPLTDVNQLGDWPHLLLTRSEHPWTT